MSNYSFRAHAASDRRKWIIVTIAILFIVAVIVSGCLTDWFTNWNKYCLFGHDYNEDGKCTRCGAEKLDEVQKDKKDPISEDKEASVNGGGMITGESVGNNINLASRRILRDEYAQYGIMPIVESAQQLTATVNPADATDNKLDWSVSFANPSREWATGKTVTEYVTVSPVEDGALTANVQCLQPFGEQIIITARSRQDSEIFGTATVDYVKRVTSVSLTLESSEAKFGSTYNVNAEPVYTDGTLTGTFTHADYSVELANSLKSIKSITGDPFGYYQQGTTYLLCSLQYTFTGVKFSKDTGAHTFSLQGSSFYDFGTMDLSAAAGGTNNKRGIEFESADAALRYGQSNCVVALKNTVNNKFLDTIKAESGDHLTFTLSYTYTYDGVVNDSKTTTFGLRFDASTLVVHVTSIEFNQNLVF